MPLAAVSLGERGTDLKRHAAPFKNRLAPPRPVIIRAMPRHPREKLECLPSDHSGVHVVSSKCLRDAFMLATIKHPLSAVSMASPRAPNSTAPTLD